MIELAPQHKRGLVLRAPVMNAAGVLGFAGEYRGLLDFASLGAFVANPITFHARTPTAPPNAVVTPDGLLIHTGLPNPGLRSALRRYRRDWFRLGPPVIVHLAATTLDEVRRSRDALEREEVVSGVELGFRDDVTVSVMEVLIRAMRGGQPLLMRLPLARAPQLAEAAARAGADALVIGAPPRLSVESDGRAITGRVYGPAQFETALEAVRAVAALDLGLPLVGAGGIYSIEDARKMLAAGAAAVQLDAVLWRDPGILTAFTAGGP
jgi:dihydroorotate dehydrogenase (NAD+) catalytic subunit